VDHRAIEVASGVSVFAASNTSAASIRLQPGTRPTSPQDGDIYKDSTDHHVYCYDTFSSSWKQLDN
jgi:hypothetical protein